MAKGKGKARSAGEGTVRWHARDSNWEARLYIPQRLRHAYGGKSRLSFYGKTQAQAIEKREKARQELEEVYTSPKDLTFGLYLQRWLEGPLSSNVSPRTYEDYQKAAEKHLIPRIGDRPLRELTAEELDNLYGRMAKDGVGVRTINHVHSAARVALGRAVKKRLIPYNPARDADPPRYSTNEREYRTLSKEEVGAFFEAVSGDRFEALFVMAVLAGPRPAELRALSWSDADLPDGQGAGEARIRRTVSETKARGMEIRNTTKTGKARPVYLFPEVVEALKSHKAAQNEERLRKGSLWEDQGLVFPNEVGRIADGRHISQRHLKPALRRADLPKEIRMYDLRHSFATLWIESGEEMKLAQEILGHSRIETTANLYMHPTNRAKREAFERFGESFRKSQ